MLHTILLLWSILVLIHNVHSAHPGAHSCCSFMLLKCKCVYWPPDLTHCKHAKTYIKSRPLLLSHLPDLNFSHHTSPEQTTSTATTLQTSPHHNYSSNTTTTQLLFKHHFQILLSPPLYYYCYSHKS